MTITSTALDGLLYIRNGDLAGRWNFPDAVGTPFNLPGGTGNAVSLSYSFLGSLPGYSSESGFLAFNDHQKQATRSILSSIESLIDVDFNEITGVGQLTFGMSSQSAGQGGFAYAPAFSYAYRSNIESVTELATGGDVWINRHQSWVADDWLPGHDGYATLLHETGHALGLKHPFDGDLHPGCVTGRREPYGHVVHPGTPLRPDCRQRKPMELLVAHHPSAAKYLDAPGTSRPCNTFMAPTRSPAPATTFITGPIMPNYWKRSGIPGATIRLTAPIKHSPASSICAPGTTAQSLCV
jgi:hypothetical protein